MIGICFGHQVIADALGGDVRKSDKGWGLGRHTYQIKHKTGWMGPNPPDTFSVGVSHQDQVLSPPPDAIAIGGNDFAPNAALAYSRGPIISFQGHPEFSDKFLEDLYNVRRGTKFTDAFVDEAVASFKTPDDNKLMARWMVNFIHARH